MTRLSVGARQLVIGVAAFAVTTITLLTQAAATGSAPFA